MSAANYEHSLTNKFHQNHKMIFSTNSKHLFNSITVCTKVLLTKLETIAKNRSSDIHSQENEYIGLKLVRDYKAKIMTKLKFSSILYF